MTDAVPDHLTDDTLNEYLDAALAPSAREAADAHLLSCAACTLRLQALRALFADLGALPDLPLSRDLAPNVMQATRPTLPVPQPSAATRQPLYRLIVPLQILAALVLLALVWPFIAARLDTLPVLAPPAIDLLNALTDFWRLASATARPAQLWASLLNAGRAGWATWPLLGDLAVPVPGLMAAAALAGVVWLLTNLWLLRTQPPPHRPLRRP